MQSKILLMNMIKDLYDWGWTQQQIANETDVSQTTVYRWGTGTLNTTNHLTYPKVERLWKKEKRKSKRIKPT